jgi:EAL domain-containing protein (putative c-di-GMP-specific phosphodiesterase class I)
MDMRLDADDTLRMEDEFDDFALGTDPGDNNHLGPLEERALASQLSGKDHHALPTDLASLTRCYERALRSLFVSFQPIVRSNATLFGYEALLRPNDPVLMHPVAMLEAGERLGRIEQLGRIIRLRIAEAYMAARPARTLIFVNLHAKDLYDRSLLSRFAPLTQISRNVVLEITERTSLENLTDIRERVAELRQLGFQIAIDDLGAGHSRMRMLTPVDCDYVKLDQSLVRDIDRDIGKQELVHSITRRCHQHGIVVIGEGIETDEEAAILQEIGCDLLQGFLFGRPAPGFC